MVHTAELTYFSRLSEAEPFQQAALGEIHARGVEKAETVCAVSDGADWIPKFVDYHRQDAVRILDFAHAMGYVADAGQAAHEHLPCPEGLTEAEERTNATFQAQGYPIGSGSVESANKVGVQSRLKGAGMRWADEHVNAMLAMRNLACNDHWDEGWSAIRKRWQQEARTKRHLRAGPPSRQTEGEPAPPCCSDHSDPAVPTRQEAADRRNSP